MVNNLLNLFSNLDRFAILMISLIVFIGLCVCSFASRYMRGDTKYRSSHPRGQTYFFCLSDGER